MKLWCVVIVTLALLLVMGCDKTNKNMTLNETDLLGKWLPDTKHSNCPTVWLNPQAVLLISANGTCEARNFATGVFKNNYTAGGQESVVSLVVGSWQLKSEGEKSQIKLRWKIGEEDVDGGAVINYVGKQMVIEFWIGYPDPYPRLLLQKATGS